MTKCECHGPGYCERHNMRKSPHLWKLCQTRDDYFQMWEEGRGPGQLPTGTAAPLFATWKPPDDVVHIGGKRLVITVATGDMFHELLEVTGAAFAKYAAKHGADYVALTGTTQDWWGLEKFRVHRYASYWEKTVYFDADVVVKDTTPDLFEMIPDGGVLIHNDWPHLTSHEWVRRERAGVLESQGLDFYNEAITYNSGVVGCTRSSAGVWLPPPKRLPTTHCAEQFWVESNCRQYEVKELETELNCQYWMPDFLARAETAPIVHLANCEHTQRLEMSRQLLGMPPMGLGDMVEAGLRAIGITKERYQNAKAAVGLKRKCGCKERQEKLNKIGRAIGIGSRQR